MSMIDTPMSEGLGRFLDVDVARFRLIGANLANIDTPGYHTRDLNFRAELARASALSAGGSTGEMVYASYTPVAQTVRGLMERPDGNNVSLERESLLLADAQMKFNLGIQILKDQFHQMAQAINSGGTSS
jgi:flagellar basal-body rod protein FlgB